MLRQLYKSDIDQILAIEESVHVAPWAEDTFHTCFDAGYLGWCIESNKRIVGFVMASYRADECHILNLCVARPQQGQGWGRKLMEHALAEASRLGILVAYLEVRASNSRAIELYKKMHFQQIGERRHYYPTVSGHEDALIFAKTIELPL